MPDWLIIRTFWDLTVTGLALGSIYALVALGYTLVYGVLRLINFAHSEIFMVGTFGSLLASSQFLNIPLLEDGNYPYRTGMTLVFFLVVILIIAMLFSGESPTDPCAATATASAPSRWRSSRRSSCP